MKDLMEYTSLQEFENALAAVLPSGTGIHLDLTERVKNHLLSLAAAEGELNIKMGVHFFQEMTVSYLDLGWLKIDIRLVQIIVPESMRAIANYYEVQKTDGTVNFSTGSIEYIPNLNIPVAGLLNTIEEGGRYQCTYVSLGQNYFKSILKVCV